MNTIVLAGCTPEPLGNYLKALGVFRLVAEQADPGVRAWWKDGVFHVSTEPFASTEALATWLFCQCQFSPLVAPWQTGSGYLPMGKREKGAAALQSLLASDRAVFRRFRDTFRDFAAAAGVQLPEVEPAKWIETLAKAASTDGPSKDLLQQISAGRSGEAHVHRMLRNVCREVAAVEWLDAVGSVPSSENDQGVRWFGLLASGGGEASGQYVVNLQQRLVEKLQLDDGDGAGTSRDQLMAALTGMQSAGVLEANTMGAMYYPALIKGFNSGQTFASKPDRRVNPWDFILLLEGTLLWASATTRRQLVIRQLASFPFFCRSALGGAATLATSEAEGSPGSPTRGELWCPLWDVPATIGTLRALFSEGRLQLGERTCATALEFARAVSRFGVERGISAFARFGLLERSGSGKQRTLLAVPLGRWAPRRLPHIELLDELDAFQENVGDSLQHHDSQPKRLLLARVDMESAVFDVASQPLAADAPEHAQRLLDVLVASAALERELGVRCGRVKVKAGQRLMDQTVFPIYPLSTRWIDAVDDGTAEFRLARAVASIAPWRGSDRDGEPVVGSLRSNLLPLRREGGRWIWDDRSRSAVWSRGVPLLENMATVLQRRLIDASRTTGEGLPLRSSAGTNFRDLLRLWHGEIDEERVEDLIHALALVDIAPDRIASAKREEELPENGGSTDRAADYQAEFDAARELPRAYALMKLCFIGGRLPARPKPPGVARRSGDEPFPPTAPDVLNLLLAGRVPDALRVAARRLRAKGYPPIVPDRAFRSGEFTATAAEGRRLAGLLLVPVRRAEVLATLVFKPQAN